MKKSLQYIFGEHIKSLEAKFLPELVELTYLNLKTNAKETKYIDYDSFFNAVNTSTVINTGLLAGGVRYFCKSEGEIHVLIEDFPKPQTLIFHDKHAKDQEHAMFTYENVTMPGVLLFASMKEGQGVVGGWVWSIPKPIISLTDPIFVWPFGNSFGNSGQFCWGSSQEHWRNIKYPAQLKSLFSLIYGSTFNGDLGTYVSLDKMNIPEKNRREDSFDMIYKYCQNKPAFPSEILIKCGTVENAIKSLEREDR